MVASNGRFFLGVLLGALAGVLVGAGLYHLSTGLQPSCADDPTELVPGGALEPSRDDRPSPVPLALPRTEPASLRAEGSTEPASAAPLSELELASLVDGVAGTQATAGNGTGAIWGRVVDAEGAGLEGVVLRLTRRPRSPSATPASRVGAEAPELESLEDAVRAAAERFREQRAHLREVRTDVGGAYRFEGLGDGPWSLRAYLDGYLVQADGSAWELPTGSEVDFTARRVVEVPVQVYEPDGALATAARFTCDAKGANSRTVHYGWNAAESYLRLTPGSYELTAYSDDGAATQDATRTSEPQEVLVTAEGAPEPMRFDLQTRLTIRGTVAMPEDGVRSENLAVFLMPLSPQQEVDLELLTDSDRVELVSPGSEFTFVDLEAGRYLVGVGRTWNAPIGAHEVVDLDAESVRLTLQLPPLDRSRYLAVSVLSPTGETVSDVFFSVGTKYGRPRGSSGRNLLRDEAGAYLIPFEGKELSGYFDETQPAAEYTLQVMHAELASRKVALVRGQTELTVTFSVPAALEVTVVGYQGSGYEGRLWVMAQRMDGDERSPFYRGSRSDEMSVDGVQGLVGLEPGRYVVSLNVRPKDSANVFSATTIDRVELDVLSGENTLQMSLPVLHRLRVHWSDGKDGAYLAVRPRSGAEGVSSSAARAQLDAQGYATFEDLRAGDYVLSSWGGGVAQMYVTVPSEEVEFAPMTVDAIRVSITDPGGDLATVGFRDGDLIIGRDGEEFADTPDFGLLNELQSSKSAQVAFLILRGGKTLELVVKGADVGDWKSMGGRLLPDQR